MVLWGWGPAGEVRICPEEPDDAGETGKRPAVTELSGGTRESRLSGITGQMTN